MVVDQGLLGRFRGATDTELGLGRAPAFHVYIRGQQFERLGELTDWSSLSFETVFNGMGTWQLETSSESVEAALLGKRGGIIVTREVGGAEETVFSGPVATEWGYTARTFRAAGYSDEYWLLEPARPTPSLPSPPWPDDSYVETRIASSLMRNLIAINIGDPAPVERKIAPIAFPPDPFLGSVITVRANLEPMLTVLANLAITPFAGGLGFYLRQSDTQPRYLQFTIYEPPDKSADAKFAVDLNTISDYEDFQEAPAGNRVWVMGGDGFGANRTVIEAEDADSIAEWGQLPGIVIDNRGTADTGELNQRAAEEIAKVSTLKRVAVTPFDVPSLQYGTDYDLGTLVTIVTKSGEVVDLIRSVQITLDPERGAVIVPIVGQGDGSDDERMATITRTIQDRMSNLERNWNVPPDSIDDSMLHPFVKWSVGDLRATVRAGAQPGWLLCTGQTVSQSTYSALYAVLGATWNTGGETAGTFRLPDARGRSLIGASGLHPIGQTGGAETGTGPAHTHPGAHQHTIPSHDHSGPAHTHPGAHSHGMDPHRHQMGHDHPMNHNHGGVTQLPSATSTRADGTNAVASAGHWHGIPTDNSDTQNSNNTVTGDGEKTSGGTVFTRTITDSDTGTFAAAYAGNTGGTSGAHTDDNTTFAPGASYSGSISTMSPYFVGNWEIFAGA